MDEFLLQIDNIFHDSQVDEVGYMMNTDGPLVLYSDKNLGISTTIVKPLYKYSLVKFSALNKSLHSDFTIADFQHDIISLSRILLIIKGDLPMAFKYRKLLIESNLSSIGDEITFLNILFSKHPKTPSGWFHRRWCLDLNRQRQGRADLTCGEIETEREFCRNMCERNPKNYYAWTYRQWLLSFMTNVQLENELSFTKEWLMSHISDHSASNHRIQVIVQILSRGQGYFRWVGEQEENGDDGDPNSVIVKRSSHERSGLRGQALGFLFRLLVDSQMLLLLRPGHEALWYHRRALFSVLLVLVQGMQKGSLCVDIETIRMNSDQEDESYSGWGMPNCLPSNNSSEEGTDSSLITSTDSAQAFCEKTADMATRITDLLLRCARDNCSSGDVLKWLTLQLRFESTLCQWCVSVRDVVWDTKLQRLMATRYCAFVFDAVLERCTQSENGKLYDVCGRHMLVGILGAEATEKFVVSMDKAVTESFVQSSFRNHCVSVLLLLLQQLMTLDTFSQIWQSKIRQYS